MARKGKAKADSYQSILSDIQDGVVPTAKRLRDILNALEINVLELELDQYDYITDAISDEPAATDDAIGGASLDTLRTKTEDEPHGQDTFTSSPDKFHNLKPYADILNAEKFPTGDYNVGQKYERGHKDASVATLLLVLLRKHYKVKNATSRPELAARKMKLIDDALKISSHIDKISQKELKRLRSYGKAGDQLEQVIKAAGTKIDFNVTMQAAVVDNLQNGIKTTLTIEMELKEYNGQKGALTQALLLDLRSVLGDSKVPDAMEARVAKVRPKKLHASPSIEERLDAWATAVLSGKKFKSRNSKKRYTNKAKLANTAVAARTLKNKLRKRVKNLQAKLRASKTKKAFIIPTVSLKAIINESLDDYIQLKMRDSSAPASKSYLRYQTGRFAESAKLLILNRQDSGIYFGVYTYQKDPYAVFEPGRSKGTVGRDPRLYIEGAAREIAMRVLKKQFVGLYLEDR